MVHEKGSAAISLDAERIEPQTFAEIPLTVRNNTLDVLVLDTFLMRHDAPGNVVVLREPPWKHRIYGTLDSPLAQCETEVHVTFLMPGEELTSTIVVKLLFAPDHKRETPQRFVGRLTYERVGLEEFEKGVVRRSLELPKADELAIRIVQPGDELDFRDTMESIRPGPTLPPVDYWPGGGTREEAFTKMWVSVAPNPIPGPQWIDPSAEVCDVYWWVYSVALRTWAYKEPGLCVASWKDPLGGIELPVNTDLTLFDYADACALAGLDEVTDGFLAGEMIGGNAPELDELDFGIKHYASYGGRCFSVKICDLLDTLVKIGESKDFSKVDFIGVDVWPGRPKRPVTPDTDWSDVWRNRGVRNLGADPAYNPPRITGEVLDAIRDRIDKDLERYRQDIHGLFRPAQDTIQAGVPPEEVWAETQDRIIALVSDFCRLDHVIQGHRDDPGHTASSIMALRSELWDAADALGIDTDKIDPAKCDREIDKALGIPNERDVVEEVPQEIREQFEKDVKKLLDDFEELVKAGRARIEAGHSPEAVWAETEDHMIGLYDGLERCYELGKHKWAEPYQREFENQIFKVAYSWE